MRNAVIVVAALLSIVLFPKSSFADSVEYSVSIDVTWTYSVIDTNAYCGSSCSDVAVQLASSFDIYGNGTVVPGSMISLVSGPDVTDGSGFTFDTVPPSFSASQTGNTSFTAGSPFNWSNQGNVITFLPPGCSYTAPPSTCASAAWPPTGSTSFAPSTVNINCFSDDCPSVGMFSCWWQGCPEGPSGPDNPANGGSVIITEFDVAAPEPSSSLLLGIGIIFLLGYAVRWKESKLQLQRR